MSKGWGNRLGLVCLILLFFTQCQKPMNVLSRDQMLAITKDMILTEAYLRNQYQPDSIAMLYYESVLDKHGVSKEKYDSSLVWYGEHSHRLDRIYEEIEKDLIANKLELDTLYSDSIAMERIRFTPKETLWKGPGRLFLSEKQNLYYFDQSIDLDGAFSPSDTIEWYASVRPNELIDSLDLRVYLLILDEKAHYYSRHQSVLAPDSIHSLRHLISLPDSLPANGSATLYFILQKSAKSIFIDRFDMKKREFVGKLQTAEPDTLAINEPEDRLEVVDSLQQDESVAE